MLRKNILLILLLTISFVLRFIYLGYSDYQGDEIKAFYLPKNGQSFTEFLLAQRKGPVQFTVTALEKLMLGNYDQNYLVRLPFALAGFLAVYFFYKLLKQHYGHNISLIATFFFATNGFLIAFSRLAQYQSFVILFMILTLYFFSLAVDDKKRGVYFIFLGFISWAISILAHYDGIFILPFALYLLIKFWKSHQYKFTKDVWLVFASGVLAVALVAIFYIPMMTGASDLTKNYWKGRITGEISGKISSSKYLFTVYQPIYTVHVYMILFALGTAFIGILFLKKYFKIHALSKITGDEQFNPIIIAQYLWLALGVLFMEGLVYIPGTHIYVYLVPAFVILAYGINFLYLCINGLLGRKIGRILFTSGLVIVFTFITYQAFAIFVDNSKEYPWEEEQLLLWTMPIPNGSYHISLFGFPYYRDWEGIRDFIKSMDEPTIKAYSTNERVTISRYYIDLEKDLDRAGIYVYIHKSQRFINDYEEDKVNYWVARYQPVYQLIKNGEELSAVYIMPVGKYEEVVKQGY